MTEKDPRQLTGRLQAEAREAGAKARADGAKRDDYPRNYARRSLVDCWQAGWDDAAPLPPVIVQQPEVEHREPQLQTREGPDPSLFWPKGQPMPTTYRKPPVIPAVPCPKCRRLYRDDRGRAVTVSSTWQGFTYLLCMCGHSWKLETEK